MLKLPVLVILRGIEAEHLKPISEILINVGIDSVEITMNTKNAENLISEMIQISNGNLLVGAGTVLTENDLEKALQAGAKFIVTPVVDTKIIEKCVELNIAVFPGALTPSEVWQAWNAGATMVKVFPANAFGAGYIKDLKGPLNNVKLMAVGGVNKKSVLTFLEAGAEAVAIGGSIFSKKRLSEGKYEEIESDLIELITIVKTYYEFIN